MIVRHNVPLRGAHPDMSVERRVGGEVERFVETLLQRLEDQVATRAEAKNAILELVELMRGGEERMTIAYISAMAQLWGIELEADEKTIPSRMAIN